MRTHCAIGILAALLLAAPASATTKGPLPPSTDTIDCGIDDNKKTCIECGGGGILACCYEDTCDVINKPKKPKASLPPLTPWNPTLPGPGSGWELY